jgi:hypothetical protein
MIEFVEPSIGVRVKSKPVLQIGETLIYRAAIGNAVFFLIGIFLIFVPPFLFGPVVIVFIIYLNRNSGVWMTDRRLINYRMLWPGSYRQHEIPIAAVLDVKLRPTLIGV